MSPENHDAQWPDDDSGPSDRPFGPTDVSLRMSCPGRAGVIVKMCVGSPHAEIEQNDWHLHVSRYVDTSEEEERTDVAEAVWKLRELEQERAAAERTMNRYLAEPGFG